MYELVERPALDAPLLVVVLDGWIDAGLGAGSARTRLLEDLDVVKVAVFDTDALLDHRARRPTMHLVEGVLTGLTWPSIELVAASDRSGNDLLLLVGAEPDHSWRSFSDAVVELALDFGVRMVVGLGAYPAPLPHTRTSRLAVTASDPTLAAYGSVLATIDVPAGVQAAIERRAHEDGLPAAGLWAQVPHYASAMPYPEAAAVLLDALVQIGGLDIDTSMMHRQASETKARLDALIADNPEHQAMVAELEKAVDEAERSGGLPTGDEIAAELERFLREQPGD